MASNKTLKEYDINNNDMNINGMPNVAPKTKLKNKLTLLDLNVDCLAAIFDYLDFSEWIRLSKVSPIFYDVIKKSVIWKKELKFSKICQTHSVRKAFKMFGPFATNITISSFDIQYKYEHKSKSEEVLDLIAYYCSTGILKQLTLMIEMEEIRKEFCKRISKSTINLNNLTIHGINRLLKMYETTNDRQDLMINRMLQNCQHLCSVQFINIPIGATFLQNIPLNDLNELSFVDCKKVNSLRFFEMAKQLGGQVKKICWRNSLLSNEQDVSYIIDTVCRTIEQHLVNVEEVTIHMNYTYKYCRPHEQADVSILDGLLNLKKLHTLRIGCAGACGCQNFSNFITKLTMIQHLSVESPFQYNNKPCVHCSKALNLSLSTALKNLKQLKSLCISHICKHEEDLLKIISKNLVELKKLHLIGYRKLFAQKLIDFVNDAQQLKILDISQSKIPINKTMYNEMAKIYRFRMQRPLIIYVNQTVGKTFSNDIKSNYKSDFVKIVIEECQ